LAAAAPAALAAAFGARYAQWLLDAAHGRDDRPVVTVREPKSISRETTFERDLDQRRDREELSRILLGLCERVAGDLERKGYLGRTIGVKLRYADFAIVTRDVTLERPTRDAAAIRDAVRSCLKRVVFDRRLRLLGVRVGALVREDDAASATEAVIAAESLPLFE
jgi:DNA polymerase-4